MKTTATTSFRNMDSIAPWTACWQLESAAGGSKRPELDLHIEPVWHEFMDTLTEGARILDLATGNGTVALNCAERARGRGIRVHIDAVDAARINPPRQVPDPDGHLPQVRFQGGIWLEDLPFEHDIFDGVISQFGFEYADEEQAVSEVSRVLSPGGRLRLVIHALGGSVWKDINVRHKRLSGVLAENGVVTLVLALVRAQKKQDVKTFKSKLKHFADAAKNVQKLTDQPVPDDSALFFSREFLFVWSNRKQYRLDDLLRSLEDGWANASGTASRYAQMLRVARSAEDIDSLCDRLKTVGLTISSVRQVCSPDNGAQIAWQVDASKPC
jgi:ubiquinone/menaquinone biosynthesis C-methylase UbiE